jgi:hypothetical protein
VNRAYYDICWAEIRRRIRNGQIEFWFHDVDINIRPRRVLQPAVPSSGNGYTFTWRKEDSLPTGREFFGIVSIKAILTIEGGRQYNLGRANYSSIVNGELVGLDVAKSGMAMIFKEAIRWLKDGSGVLFSADNPFAYRSIGDASLDRGIKIAEVEFTLSGLVWEAIEHLYK